MDAITKKSILRQYFLLMLYGMTLPVTGQGSDNLKNGVVKITACSGESSYQYGTGIVVSVEGSAIFIVTAAHVTQVPNLKIQVEFFSRRNRQLPAKVVATEDEDDPNGISLLIVEGQNLPSVTPLAFAESNSARGGDPITVISFPLIADVNWAVSNGNVVGQKGKTMAFTEHILFLNRTSEILMRLQPIFPHTHLHIHRHF